MVKDGWNAILTISKYYMYGSRTINTNYKHMEDQLITYETAKLAKEKGFNWKVSKYIYDEFTKQTILKDMPTDYSQHKKGTKYECIGLPTQSLLQRWLREVHNKNIYIHPASYDNEKGYVFSTTGTQTHNYSWDIVSYEHALERALIASLNLL